MQRLVHDIRYALRTLLKQPGFALICLLTLALGIGANTAIFSVINAVLLKPLPFKEPDRIVRVWATDRNRSEFRRPTSYPNFVDWRKENKVFAYTAAYSQAGAILTSNGSPEYLDNGIVATGELLPMLGVQPALGRYFTEQEAQAGNAPVVIISHNLWQRSFAADPNILNRNIILDGKSKTVVGVMPPLFKFPLDADKTDFISLLDPTSEENQGRGSSYLGIVARLKPEVMLQQAQAEMDSIANELESQYADENTGRGIRLVPMHEDLIRKVQGILLVLFGSVGCVLLIACANVANLLLARVTTRHKEIAVRTALGASRWRIIRQLLTESLLLSVAGGLLGLLLAKWGLDALVALIPSSVPRAQEISIDWIVLGVTFGLSLLTGLIFGLVPALQVSNPDLTTTLKEEGRGTTGSLHRNRVRALLVVAELSISFVLLVGAGLFMRSFLHLRDVNPGFNADNVLTMEIALPDTKYSKPEQQIRFFQQLFERLDALPGIEAAGAIDPLPFSGSTSGSSFKIEEHPPLPPAERLKAGVRTISPEYFRALGIRLVKGRLLAESDNQDAPKAMLINETLARRYFPDEDPIGKHASAGTAFVAGKKYEIVGIVSDTKHKTLDTDAEPEFYVTYLQAPQPYLTLAIRTTLSNPEALTNSIRGEVQQIDSEQPIYNIKPLKELLAESVGAQRFTMMLLGIFATLAILLAGIGIYGVMSYAVTQRTHEIGIRMALGAQVTDVMRMIIRQGITLVLIGQALGLGAAFALTRVLEKLLYEVSATDTATFIVVALILTGVALLACLVPARRAAKVDPMVALHYE
jgi:putative ABC transport system permease protein